MSYSQSSTPSPGLGNYKPDYLVAKKSKLGLILGIICTIVTLLGIVIAILFAVVILKGLSEDDYKNAASKINIARKAHDKVIEYDFKIQTYSNFDGKIDYNLLNKQEEAIKKLQQEFRELGEMVAIVKNSQIKQFYDKSKADLEQSIKGLNNNIEVNGKICPILTRMISSEERHATAKAQYEGLQKIISSLKNPDNITFVNGVINLLQKSEKLDKEIMQAKQDGNTELASRKEAEFRASIDKRFELWDSWSQKAEEANKYKTYGAYGGLFYDMKVSIDEELHKIRLNKRKR